MDQAYDEIVKRAAAQLRAQDEALFGAPGLGEFVAGESLTYATLVCSVFHALSGGRDFLETADGGLVLGTGGQIYRWTKR